MKTYHIIDTEARNARAELKNYTFEELKNYFKPPADEELAEDMEKWEKIKDLIDLEEYLRWEAQGMHVRFIIEEEETEISNPDTPI